MTQQPASGTAPTTSEPLAPAHTEGAVALIARFRPVIDRIAEGAVRRERERILPFEEVQWLRDAGFAALRVPREFGGDGVTLVELFSLLVELGAADSNLPQLLRGHLGFVETQLGLVDSDTRTAWFRRIVEERILFGNAQAERSGSTGTTVTERDGRAWLNGKKFYSTGTLFADWIWSSGTRGDEPVALAVRADASGVTRVDDWDGFGQRLTGSGTTTFEEVEIDPAHVLSFLHGEPRPHSYVTSFYQLVLLASLSGIAEAAVREATGFVRDRTRTFGIPGASAPREDPLVQRVVGRISSLAFAARATTLAAAAELEAADLARTSDAADDERYAAATISVFQAQQVVIDLVLEATTLLFEIGGASATSETRALDRLWRNARTISSHNPAIHREQALGDYYLNGALPKSWFERAAGAAAPARS